MRAQGLSETDFVAFQSLAYAAAGIHLADNKREMLATRLARRLHALGLTDYRAYYQILTSGDPSGEEREHFINSVTTNKTQFFREPHHFEFLRDQLIPELRARAAAGGPKRLRIWSAACSSGEEPYSIAMIAHRELMRAGFTIEIVASDIDTEMLARAEAGVYSTAQLADVPPELRHAYFAPAGSAWQVRAELRSLIALHRVNLIHDAFPCAGPFDAIFLRNVIIYFDRPSQATLFQRLGGYLAATGYLFVGHSESLSHLTDAFSLAGQTIYRPHGPRPAARRRGRATVTRLPATRLLVSREPVRIDAVVGPDVGACVFDPHALVGGMAQLGGESARAVEHAIAELAAQLIELGATATALRAKLAGGGGHSPQARELGAQTTLRALAALSHAGIEVTSKRLGGARALEIQFFTSSGRLLCRDHEPRRG